MATSDFGRVGRGRRECRGDGPGAAVREGVLLTVVPLGDIQDEAFVLVSSLDDTQKKAAVLKLIGHYTGMVDDVDASARMAEITAGMGQTYFAWYGPTTTGGAAYFRFTGPTLVIEYAPKAIRRATRRRRTRTFTASTVTPPTSTARSTRREVCRTVAGDRTSRGRRLRPVCFGRGRPSH
jgi:hypothetical protein